MTAYIETEYQWNTKKKVISLAHASEQGGLPVHKVVASDTASTTNGASDVILGLTC